MPKSVNKVILVGNVGADPEVKYTPSGIPVGKFSLATNERFKNKSGEWQDRTEWHNIVAWQRLAEIVGEYVSKGSKVYIEGKLQTSSWERPAERREEVPDRDRGSRPRAAGLARERQLEVGTGHQRRTA